MALTAGAAEINGATPQSDKPGTTVPGLFFHSLCRFALCYNNTRYPVADNTGVSLICCIEMHVSTSQSRSGDRIVVC